mgnify:CR=1 FL=1
MILDTDVLIWYLRGSEQAKKVVEEAIPFAISAVTYMELIQGMKNKNEYRRFQLEMHRWKTRIIHIDRDISIRAVFYMQEYALSHAIYLADALIAATAVQMGDILLTGNDKHYRFIPSLRCKKFEATPDP